jgi:hypothetical protein
MTTRLDYTTLDLMDALDLAVLIEAEAYERYRMFVAQLGHRFPGDASSVFASLQHVPPPGIRGRAVRRAESL